MATSSEQRTSTSLMKRIGDLLSDPYINAEEAKNAANLLKFDAARIALVALIIGISIPTTCSSSIPILACIVGSAIRNAKWIVLVMLYSEIAELYLHTGLSIYVPWTGPWTIVPKLLPDDYEAARRLRGGGTWRCRRDRLWDWFERVCAEDFSISMLFAPAVLDMLALVVKMWQGVGLVLFYGYQVWKCDGNGICGY